MGAPPKTTNLARIRMQEALATFKAHLQKGSLQDAEKELGRLKVRF